MNETDIETLTVYCTGCKADVSLIGVTTPLWFSLDLGEDVHADEAHVRGIDTADPRVYCLACNEPIEDPRMHQRVNAHLRALEASLGATLPPMDAESTVGGVTLPPIV